MIMDSCYLSLIYIDEAEARNSFLYLRGSFEAELFSPLEK